MKQLILVTGMAAFLLVGTGPAAHAQQGKKGYDASARSSVPDSTLKTCASACRACEKACAVCSAHCEKMTKMGMTEHEKSLRLSRDCRELCRTAALLTERKGPMAVAACEACAKACDACRAECLKYPDMGPMRACAASCQKCASACRAMVAAARS